MERIGIYCGTFNPVHIGHIRAAEYAITALSLDRVIMIPDSIAPHKQLPSNSATAQQRLEMLRLAVADRPGIQVSDMALKREGISYTYQTVQQLRERYPDAQLTLLMGTDAFLGFRKWIQKDEILRHAQLGVFFRGTRGEAAAREEKVQIEEEGAVVHLIENPVTDISSTQLRRLLVFRCADPFLPAGVGDYIRSHGLYDTSKDYRNLSMNELEEVVIGLLNPNRVAHVLGCRDTAAELARHWGADETDAARAGLLHDITKAIDGPLQLTLCGEYGTIVSEFGYKYPKTLHALTGSLVAERIFGENEKVVSAICSHTTGKADMNLLEKIIYVADYMEPNRDFPGVEKLRQLAFSDMDGALRLGLEMTLEHLKRQGNEVSPESRDALAWLDAHCAVSTKI